MQVAYFLICRNAATHPYIHTLHTHNTNTMNTPNIIPATSIIVVVISYPYECTNTEHLLGYDPGCQSVYLYCGTGSQQSYTQKLVGHMIFPRITGIYLFIGHLFVLTATFSFLVLTSGF